MENRLLIWISFAMCMSLTVGAILSLFRFEKLKNLPSHQYLQYSVILIFTFGYYGLWSQYFFNLLGFSSKYAEVIKVISFMGTPFLLIGMIMQLLWINYMRIRSVKSWIIVVPFIALIAILSILYNRDLTIFIDDASDLYNVFGVIGALGSLLLISGKSETLSRNPMNTIGTLIVISIAIHSLMVVQVNTDYRYQSLVLVAYFFVHATIAVVFVYNAKVQILSNDQFSGNRFEDFLEQHGISPREKEIIQEICRGKTNQQVADSLFISLQTVKDHTSRIYLKTHVRNRTQLVRMIMDLG